ncbi:hypothetical protein TEA_000105 [Camellia sinensis var. sinensis]|uniref:Rad60/SUMO-like domain-containing protein n=1 Tax=Camellia sinensis var. sinensis TaxID=542762 RepID=A0A4S4E5E3_CAMSN|nr:hypothetical protein TEA_000105 [Camellia sinensis var. sinensis]
MLKLGPEGCLLVQLPVAPLITFLYCFDVDAFAMIKRSTQLKKLMNAYCDRQSVEFNSIAFLFDGRRLRAEQTPDEFVLGPNSRALKIASPVKVHCDLKYFVESSSGDLLVVFMCGNGGAYLE